MQVLEETAVTSAENCTDDVVEAPVSRVQVEKRDGREMLEIVPICATREFARRNGV